MAPAPEAHSAPDPIPFQPWQPDRGEVGSLERIPEELPVRWERRGRREPVPDDLFPEDLLLHDRWDPDRPIYLQIIEAVKRAVARGELAPGDRIPSQRELATRTRVNPNTVQRAYREMEHMGLVESQRGQGTFIARDPGLLSRLRGEMAQEAVGRFVAEMRALGFSPAEMAEMVRRAATGPPGPATPPAAPVRTSVSRPPSSSSAAGRPSRASKTSTSPSIAGGSRP